MLHYANAFCSAAVDKLAFPCKKKKKWGKLPFEWWFGWIWVHIHKHSLLRRRASWVSGAAAEGISPDCSERNAAPCRALRAALFFLHSTRDSAWDFLLRRKPENTCYCWQLVAQQQMDRRTDKGSCIPAYRTHRLLKSCLGINKVCLEENEWCFVVWLNGLDMLWMCYLGIFKEANGHILYFCCFWVGFFPPLN